MTDRPHDLMDDSKSVDSFHVMLGDSPDPDKDGKGGTSINMGNQQVGCEQAGKNTPSTLCKSPTMSLPIDEYQHWFDVIADNDVTEAKQILDAASPDEVERLINGKFDFQDEQLFGIFKSVNKIKFRVSRPLTIAVISAATEVTSLMLERGADPLLHERDGETLIHSLVVYASLSEESENHIVPCCETFIAKFPESKRREMLFAENKAGLRPAEQAAQLGCTRMFKALLCTSGVYVVREETKGMMRYQWIDVTDYEFSRRAKSPLGFLALMKEKTLLKPATLELFQWQPIRQWCRATQRPHYAILLLWAIVRFTQMMAFTLVLADEGLLELMGGASDVEIQNNPGMNYTFVYCSGFVSHSFGEKTRLGLTAYMGLHGVAIVVFDLWELIIINGRRSPRYLCRQHYLTLDSAVSTLFFRTSQFILGFVMAMVAGIEILGPRVSETVMQISHLVCIITMTISVLYFMQLLPGLGAYVITIQRMLRDLGHFSVLYCFWVLPFAHYFLVFFNTSTKTECAQEFSTMWRSLYSTFRMMLNMVDLTKYSVYTPHILEMMHVLYVFLVAVLLINFLIAVMSTSAARIERNKEIVVRLESLTVALLTENRLSWLLACYFRRCRHGVMVVEDGRYYLLNMTVCARFRHKIHANRAVLK